jgi:hypothetical protein
MTRVQDLGPGAKKIELERRLDANQRKMDQAGVAGDRPARRPQAQDEEQADPNDSVRDALDKSRY